MRLLPKTLLIERQCREPQDRSASELGQIFSWLFLEDAERSDENVVIGRGGRAR
jgi:hypothetical protein